MKAKILQPILINAVQMGKAHPDTFQVPDTSKVKAGDSVKVAQEGERFWVTVQRVYKNGKVIGVVDNELLCNDQCRFGDTISFHKDNIYCVHA